MTRRLYLDTSAYLTVLLGQGPAGPELVRELRGAVLCSSSLLVLEARRNLVRLGRERILEPRQVQLALARVDADTARFELRDLTLELCLWPTMPAIATPRSLDLAHLLTALWFHQRASLTRFISHDEAQVSAARELGLPV
jgi:hypothetical protein